MTTDEAEGVSLVDYFSCVAFSHKKKSKGKLGFKGNKFIELIPSAKVHWKGARNSFLGKYFSSYSYHARI